MARFHVLKEVTNEMDDGDTLCLQQGIYDYENQTGDVGFRFIRRETKSWNLKAQRGQARIPTLDMLRELLDLMEKEYFALVYSQTHPVLSSKSKILAPKPLK